MDAVVAPPERDDLALVEQTVDDDRPAVAAVQLRDRVELLDALLGHAVEPHHVGLVVVLEPHRLGEVEEEVVQEPVADDDRAGAVLHAVSESDVVEMLVREDDLLDVLDPEPAHPERGVELDRRLLPVRPRVDERQRRALDEPAVHRSRREGRRQGEQDGVGHAG